MLPCQQMPYLNNIAYCNDTPNVIGLASNIYQLELIKPPDTSFDPISTTTEEYDEFEYYGTSVENITEKGSQDDSEYYEDAEVEPTNKTKASVLPAKDFNPRKDAESLAKAMTELGADEKAIINILTKRSFEQRKEIVKAYHTWLGMNLLEDLSKEVVGKLKFLVLALMTPLPQYYALELRSAMKGVGTSESILIEILCTLTNAEIKEVKKTYVKMFNKQLEDDIRGDTSGNFRKLLLTLCAAKRSEDNNVNALRAKHLAKKLLRAGEQRTGSDPTVFTWILTSVSYVQLAEVFRQYKKLASHTINDAIRSEFRGIMRISYETLVKVVLNKQMYFAELLHRSMKGFGTNDKLLVRVIVSRCEVDLLDIAEHFSKMYGNRLDTWIEDDCSGAYRKCLLSLVGAPDRTMD